MAVVPQSGGSRAGGRARRRVPSEFKMIWHAAQLVLRGRQPNHGRQRHLAHCEDPELERANITRDEDDDEF